MKKVIVCLALLIGCNITYSSEYFQTKDTTGTVLRVQNVRSMFKYCRGNFFDSAYWMYNGADGKQYTQYYDNDEDCNEDYNKFSKRVYEYDYTLCTQNGGGSACINRKHISSRSNMSE